MFISTIIFIFYKKIFETVLFHHMHVHTFLYDSTVLGGITVKLERKYFPICLHETQGPWLAHFDNFFSLICHSKNHTFSECKNLCFIFFQVKKQSILNSVYLRYLHHQFVPDTACSSKQFHNFF